MTMINFVTIETKTSTKDFREREQKTGIPEKILWTGTREREEIFSCREWEYGNGNVNIYLGNGNGKRELKKVVPAGL